MKTKVSIQDKQLVRQLKKGNAKAQYKVYQAHYKMMYNAALRIVKDTAEAEDLMQEAFITAFDKIDTFQGDANLGAWLKRICVNRALDGLRRRHLQIEEVNEDLVANVTHEEHDDQSDKVALIMKSLAQMADNHRLLITLHLIEGYTHEEIAEQLEMSHSAVRTGYSRAKKKLQEQLASVMPLG